MNEETIKVILPMRMCGERIDSSLAEMLPHLSRSKITSSIKAGLALLNNNSFKSILDGPHPPFFDFDSFFDFTSWTLSSLTIGLYSSVIYSSSPNFIFFSFNSFCVYFI